MDRLNRFSPWRQLVQHARVQIAIGRHGQGSGDGGRGHDQDVRGDFGLFPKFRPLRHTKAMLLVNDGKTQTCKDHLGLNQRMGSHQNVNGARFEVFQQGGARGAFDRTGQQLHPHRHVPQQFPKALQMLLRQNFSRRHDGRLVPIVFRQQCREKGHHGFATAHIALQKAVHVPTCVQISSDLAQHPLLGFRQFKRKLGVVKRMEGLPNF